MKEYLPVIIASYNRYNLIKQTLDSLRANSYHDICIIVVDNSTDNKTIEYLEAQKDIILFRWGKRKKYPHLRVLWHDSFDYPIDQEESPYWNEKWSLGKQRTMGAILAPPSNYIYFSDNDMYFVKDWDKIIIQAMKNYPEFVIIGGSGQHTPGDFQPVDGYEVGESSLQVGNTMMFRREEWNRVGYFPDYNEDFWISREVNSRFNKKIGVIKPRVVIHCGILSNFKDGSINRGKMTVTHPNSNMEETRRDYPELIFQ